MPFESELSSSIRTSCSVTYISGSSNIAKHLLSCARWPAEPLSALPDGAGTGILLLRSASSRSCVPILIILQQFVARATSSGKKYKTWTEVMGAFVVQRPLSKR